MFLKTTVAAAAMAASLIAVPAFAQNAQPAQPGQQPRPAGAQPAAAPPMNPNAYAAIENIRAQWLAARDAYVKAQQAELAARNNYERATASLLGVFSAATNKPPLPGPLSFSMQIPPAPGQPVPPAGGGATAPRP